MVLVISNREDEHADAICEELERRKHGFFRINTEEYPNNLSASVSLSAAALNMTLLIAGVSYDLSNVRSVVYRRPLPPERSDDISEEDHKFVIKESEEFLGAIWRLLRERKWVNPIAANRTAGYKPFNLREAANHGFLIPATVMSNDQSDILDFASRCPGKIIYKPFTFFAQESINGFSKAIYTNLTTLDRLSRAGVALTAAPGIYQEYIDKKIELRITVIGNEVFACSIDSQKSMKSKIDWRHYDFSEELYKPFCLPTRIETLARSYVHGLGLVFGCIDMIVTPDDRYVFLEINPNGQWLWIEACTKLPLMDAYINLLIGE
ncbi:MvdC/MvdD family ATP grasp protein [Granulicella sp. S190]|uniref:MvdC/MvdD family ATP grasp protein n=1 Tax=Granulicella sp. S190 TaxID=1747226 RepID=UPI00131C25C4|nr:hypothetical protein [Granulicella sp. S190]